MAARYAASDLPGERNAGRDRIRRARRREQCLIARIGIGDVVKAAVHISDRLRGVVSHPERAALVVGRADAVLLGIGRGDVAHGVARLEERLLVSEAIPGLLDWHAREGGYELERRRRLVLVDGAVVRGLNQLHEGARHPSEFLSARVPKHLVGGAGRGRVHPADRLGLRHVRRLRDRGRAIPEGFAAGAYPEGKRLVVLAFANVLNLVEVRQQHVEVLVGIERAVLGALRHVGRGVELEVEVARPPGAGEERARCPGRGARCCRGERRSQARAIGALPATRGSSGRGT